MASNALATTAQPGAKKLMARLAARFGVDDDKLANTLKATVFNTGANQKPVTNEELMMLLVIVEEHGLNPFTREIYAFVDKHKGVVPIVSVDGWARIINNHPEFDGLEFNQQPQEEWSVYQDLNGCKPCPDWMEVKIFRKDRSHPIVVREYLDEVYRPPFKPQGKNYEITGPWQSHTKRFFRHKTLVQGSRVAFSFAGIYDEDEGRRIIDGEIVASSVPERPAIAPPQRKSAAKGSPTAEDTEKPATKKQIEALHAMVESENISIAELCEAMQIDTIEDLPASRVQEAMAWLATPPVSGGDEFGRELEEADAEAAQEAQ